MRSSDSVLWFKENILKSVDNTVQGCYTVISGRYLRPCTRRCFRQSSISPIRYDIFVRQARPAMTKGENHDCSACRFSVYWFADSDIMHRGHRLCGTQVQGIRPKTVCMPQLRQHLFRRMAAAVFQSHSPSCHKKSTAEMCSLWSEGLVPLEGRSSVSPYTIHIKTNGSRNRLPFVLFVHIAT